MVDDAKLLYNIKLSTFTNLLENSLDAQNAMLPSLNLLNIHDVWGSTDSKDIKVRCNKNDKVYVMVGDAFMISQLVHHRVTIYDEGYYADKYSGVMKDIFINRGGLDISYDIISKEQAEKLFYCWSEEYSGMAPYTYLDAFAGENGKSAYGYLYLRIISSYNYWGKGVEDLTFYNMFNNTYETYNTWYLYDHLADRDFKVILIQR